MQIYIWYIGAFITYDLGRFYVYVCVLFAIKEVKKLRSTSKIMYVV